MGFPSRESLVDESIEEPEAEAGAGVEALVEAEAGAGVEATSGERKRGV